MEEYKFPGKIEIRLDWSELDVLGHINNVMYFKYLQAARVAYSEMIGLYLKSPEGMGFILADTRCSFKQPLYFPGSITVRTSVAFLKNTSIGLYHQIINEKGGIAAEGQDVIVLYNFTKGIKTEIPADLRKRIEKLEEKTYEKP
jgi:acyl-CoA thioester hydrolase